MIVRRHYIDWVNNIIRNHPTYKKYMEQIMQDTIMYGQSKIDPEFVAQEVMRELQLPEYKEWLKMRAEWRKKQKKECPIVEKVKNKETKN